MVVAVTVGEGAEGKVRKHIFPLTLCALFLTTPFFPVQKRRHLSFWEIKELEKAVCYQWYDTEFLNSGNDKPNNVTIFFSI